MKTFFQSLDKNEQWDLEMRTLYITQNLIDTGEIISKSSCYYPRLKDTNKRGRVAFIELYKRIKETYNQKLNMKDFELFICKNKDWKIHEQPTDRHGSLNIEYILETEIGYFEDYLTKFEYLSVSIMPSITINKTELDNVTAVKNLCNNFDFNQSEYIELIKYFVDQLEQASWLVDSP